MERKYFDWDGSHLHVIGDFHNGGKTPKPNEPYDTEVESFYDFDEFLNSLTEPTEIIGEPSFESFALQRRQEIVSKAAEDHHCLLTIPSRKTGYRRKQLGFSPDDKCDALDVYVIRQIANDGKTRLKTARVYSADDPLPLARKAAQAQLVHLRQTTTKRPKKNAKVGQRSYTRVNNKKLFARELMKRLPNPKTIDPIYRMVLCDGAKYNEMVVAAVGVIVQHTRNRDDFTMVAGLLDCGYPSIMRSDFMRHLWVNKLRIKMPPLPPDHKKLWRTNKKTGERVAKPNLYGMVTPTQFQRAIRWLRSQIILTSGNGQPDLRTNTDNRISITAP